MTLPFFIHLTTILDENTGRVNRKLDENGLAEGINSLFTTSTFSFHNWTGETGYTVNTAKEKKPFASM